MYTLDQFVTKYADTVDQEFGMTLEVCSINESTARIDAYNGKRTLVVAYSECGRLSVVQSRQALGEHDPARIIRYWFAQQLALSILNDNMPGTDSNAERDIDSLA